MAETSEHSQRTSDNPAAGLRKGLTAYGDTDFSLFLRKAFIKGAGYSDDALDRKIVGIVDTRSGYNPCHANVPQLIEAISRGVMLSGALPIPFPTISLHESFAHPTSMYLRNLMAMDTEEMLRAQPMDAVVLIGGCDKTVPAQLMGAISADIPAVECVVGPMVTGRHVGQRVGACTDCRGYWAKYRAGEIDLEEISKVGQELVPSAGTCGVMGTASTMALISEALGVSPLGSACAPANGAQRLRIAEQCGRLAAAHPRKPSDVLTKDSFHNAICVLQAIGGSTNAVVHLLAIAGRVDGLNLSLGDIDQIGRDVPLLVDLKPSGDNYMEDLAAAGGLPTILRELRPLLRLSAMTVTGRTLGDELDSYTPSHVQYIVRPLADPLGPPASLVVLRGNLAPGGAVLKQSAMLARLKKHRGKAMVFGGMEDMISRIDRTDLDVDENSVLVLQNIGPIGHPGMPEAGYIPIPKKLAARGVKDMLRLSDGRMSGTAFGAVVLHIAPEAAAGGPLAVVQTGDEIEVDVEARKLHLCLSDEELRQRLQVWQDQSLRKRRTPNRGYAKLYHERVLQADKGADFDFLVARPEAP